MAGTQRGHHVTNSKNHTKSIGEKLKDVAVGTAKQAAKDLTTAAMIAGPGKFVRGAEAAVAGAAKAVAKNAAKKELKQNIKNVNAIADIQQKVKAETIASNSVKTVPKRRTAMDDAQRISANHAETNRVAERKSGALAKTTASRVNTHPMGKAKPIVIRSN